jgi:tetratricopeptide (TPR) repeat protein
MHISLRVSALVAAAALAAVAPRALQAQATCSVDLYTPAQLAQASILINKAAEAPEGEEGAKALRDAGRLLGDARRFAGNPTGHAMARAQLYVLWMHRADTPASMTIQELNMGRDRETRITLMPTVDSLFTIVETALPDCASEIDRWRQSKPWNDRITAAYRLLGAGNVDSAEAMAREAMILDRRSPFLYNALAQIAAARNDMTGMLTQLGKAIELANQDTSLVETTRQMRTQYASVLQGYAAGLTDPAERNRELTRAARLFLELGLESPMGQDGPAFLSQVLDIGMMTQNDSLIDAVLTPLLATPDAFPDISLLLGGETARMRQRPADAMALYRAALAKNPNIRDANYFLAYLLLEANKPAETTGLTDKLIEIDPSNPDNYMMKSIATRQVAQAAATPAERTALTRQADQLTQQESQMTLRLQVTSFERRAEGAVLQGTIENRGRAAKAYTVNVSFLDLQGAVVETVSVTTAEVAPNGTGEFTVTATKPGIVAWKYAPVQ